jgi:hypothetical protein
LSGLICKKSLAEPVDFLTKQQQKTNVTRQDLGAL